MMIKWRPVSTSISQSVKTLVYEMKLQIFCLFYYRLCRYNADLETA